MYEAPCATIGRIIWVLEVGEVGFLEEGGGRGGGVGEWYTVDTNPDRRSLQLGLVTLYVMLSLTPTSQIVLPVCAAVLNKIQDFFFLPFHAIIKYTVHLTSFSLSLSLPPPPPPN